MAPKTDPYDSDKPAAGQGRFSYGGIDRVIHEKSRLSILASLAAHNHGLVFNDLKRLCSLTDGNLSRHLLVLSDAGLVKTRKTHRGPRPQSRYRLTFSGKRRFVEYLSVLEDVISDAQRDARPKKRLKLPTTSKLSPV